NKAAFMAREALERYQLPEGTVLNTTVVGSRYDALLNIGARQGVRAGMRFVVLRGQDLVGTAQASSVDPDKSVARVVQNYRGVNPEAKVRAIYELPAVRPTAGSPGPAGTEPTMRVAAYAPSSTGQPQNPGPEASPGPSAPTTTEGTEPEVV